MWEKIHDTGFGNNFLDGIATKTDKWDYIKLRKNHNNQGNTGVAQRTTPQSTLGAAARGVTPGLRSGAAATKSNPRTSNPTTEVRGCIREELPQAPGQGRAREELGQGQRLRGATPPPRSHSCAQEGWEELLHSRSGGAAMRRYPSSKVRSSGCASLEQL